MKITKKILENIIKEEIVKVLSEQTPKSKPNLNIGKLRKPSLSDNPIQKQDLNKYSLSATGRSQVATKLKTPKLKTLERTVADNIFTIAKNAYRDQRIELKDLMNLFNALAVADKAPEYKKAAVLAQREHAFEKAGLDMDITLGKLDDPKQKSAYAQFPDKDQKALQSRFGKEIELPPAWGVSFKVSL